MNEDQRGTLSRFFPEQYRQQTEQAGEHILKSFAPVLPKDEFRDELTPARRELLVATKEQIAAERGVEAATEKETETKRGVQNAEANAARARKDRIELDLRSRYSVTADGQVQQATVTEAIAARQLDQARNRNEEAIQQTTAAKCGLLQSRAGEKQAAARTSQDAYEIAKSREDTAQGQAQNLGSMSVLDIMAGHNADLAAKQIGHENLSQQQKADRHALFPEATRVDEERIGERLAKSLRPQSAEYRDNLSDARRNTDAARAAAMGSADDATETATRGYADVLGKGLDKLTDAILNRINAAVNKIERDAMLRNNQPSS